METRSGIHGADPLERFYAGTAGRLMKAQASTASHDPDDFKTISDFERTFGELGRSHSLSIVLHHHTAREQPLAQKELFNGARKLGRNGFAIGDHGHGQSVVG
jgi:hypothetical protein